LLRLHGTTFYPATRADWAETLILRQYRHFRQPLPGSPTGLRYGKAAFTWREGGL